MRSKTPFAVLFVVACSGAVAPPPSTTDAGGSDAGQTDAGMADGGQADAGAGVADGGDAGSDAGIQPECEWGGAPGTCLGASACGAIIDHSSEPGTCSASLLCCIDTPDTADNPPTPAGYRLMQQSQVTPAMTTWAVNILHDPVTFPMYATTTQTFGTLNVLALVEWHPPDFQNGVIHRGVTLFEPQ